MSVAQLRTNSLLGLQSLSTAASRSNARPLASRVYATDQKGFGSGQGSAPSAPKKVSKRGTPASRPGTTSPKDLQKSAQQLEAQQQAEPDARPASSSSAADTVPSVITDRMLKRMVLFTGVPAGFGILLFPFFYWLKVVQKVDVPTAAVYVIQSFVFGGALAGITYGALSTSWDPRREGSLLGLNEFKANLPIVLNRGNEQR